MTSIFWSNDPSILLNKEYIYQVWPSPKMTHEEKLNAISRLVILFTILGFLITMSRNILIIGTLTLTSIFILYVTQSQKITKETLKVKESFSNNSVDQSTPQTIINPDTLQTFLRTEFQPTNANNPLGNVLLTEITDNPNRKPAPPSFNTEVYEDINVATKKMVQELNPGIKNTDKQLFGDLGEQFEFDQSQWTYYSNPNTKVCNDQGAFANFLYGNMPSARDGNAFALIQDNPRYTLY